MVSSLLHVLYGGKVNIIVDSRLQPLGMSMSCDCVLKSQATTVNGGMLMD